MSNSITYRVCTDFKTNHDVLIGVYGNLEEARKVANQFYNDNFPILRDVTRLHLFTVSIKKFNGSEYDRDFDIENFPALHWGLFN